MAASTRQAFKLGIIIESKWPVETALEFTKSAEQNGYSDAWVNDYIFDRDPFSIMSVLAVNTTKIRLGTGVVNPYLRHPATLATSIGTVAQLAPQRTVLGLGSSVNRMLKPIALTVDHPFETCKEAIDIVRLLLHGDPADYNGSRFKLDKAKLSFKIAGELPIFLALGTGKKLMQLCGEYTDGTFLMEAKEEFHEDVLKTVMESRKVSKRKDIPFEVIANQLISVGKNRKEAIDSLKPVMASNIARKGEGVTMMGLDLQKAQEYAKDPSLIPDDFMQRFALCGTVDDCLDHISDMQKLGITQNAHRFPSLEQVKVVGELLVPALRENYG